MKKIIIIIMFVMYLQSCNNTKKNSRIDQSTSVDSIRLYTQVDSSIISMTTQNRLQKTYKGYSLYHVKKDVELRQPNYNLMRYINNNFENLNNIQDSLKIILHKPIEDTTVLNITI